MRHRKLTLSIDERREPRENSRARVEEKRALPRSPRNVRRALRWWALRISTSAFCLPLAHDIPPYDPGKSVFWTLLDLTFPDRGWGVFMKTNQSPPPPHPSSVACGPGEYITLKIILVCNDKMHYHNNHTALVSLIRGCAILSASHECNDS